MAGLAHGGGRESIGAPRSQYSSAARDQRHQQLLPRSPHRLIAAALALAGASIATYLTLYQTGTLATVWEPFLGSGSRAVMDSALARGLPVPDAALGAAGYLVELVLALAGGDERGRHHPWLVLLYGLVVAGFVAGSIGLVLVQAFVVGHFCTLCLASAAISFIVPLLVYREIADTVRLLLDGRPSTYSPVLPGPGRTIRRAISKLDLRHHG